MPTKQQDVRAFYDSIGWTLGEDGLYQNARYEDLRPVSQEYIHRCHQRVLRYIAPHGRLLLDVGSGPLQYPEYLSYSQDYRFRVCADLSITALQEARRKLGTRGLFVVADAAALPFRSDVFDSAVSMHTFHHLPLGGQKRAYLELARTMTPGATAAVVNGWQEPTLMRLAEPFVGLGRLLARRGRKRKKDWSQEDDQAGTFVEKLTPRRLKQDLDGAVEYQIHPWRSLSPRFMRWFIRPHFGGRNLLSLVFRLEERFPKFFGEHGQYPLISVRKLQG
jgi:SAM-dependent methyltransferase